MFGHGPRVVLGRFWAARGGRRLGKPPPLLERCPGKDEISMQ